MKKFLAYLLLLPVLAAAPAVEKIDLGSGRSAVVTVPESWAPAALPPRPPGVPVIDATVRYAPKNGANEAVLISLIVVPDDRMADPAALKAMSELASRRFARGSVEGRADFQEFKVGGHSGLAARFTDASLVGKPSVPDDYKTMTCCFVYLGDRVMLNASIFSDDPAGEGYAAAKKIIQSLTLSLPQNTI
jgi:hypothetical protein